MRSLKRYLLPSLVVLALTLSASAQLSRPRDGARPSPSAQTAPNQRAKTNRAFPPTPPETEALGLSVFLDYAVIVLLGGAVIAVSLIPGKRGHQD